MGWGGSYILCDQDGFVAEFAFNDFGVVPLLANEYLRTKNPFVAPEARPKWTRGPAPLIETEIGSSDLVSSSKAPTPIRYEGAPFELNAYFIREPLPKHPLRVSMLNAAMRERALLMQLPIRFLDHERVQPADHIPCGAIAGSEYILDTDDQTIRPVPGREDGYDPEGLSDLAGDASHTGKPLVIQGLAAKESKKPKAAAKPRAAATPKKKVAEKKKLTPKKKAAKKKADKKR